VKTGAPNVAATEGRAGGRATWVELQQLLRLRGFRKLFAVRLVSQMADGMFQVGLATLLFFSPESMGTAAGVAAGFAVMLAPFTIVGPFAGVLLDRWPRRQILLYGNLIRAVITAAMAWAFMRHGEFGLVHILGLAALSVNRFLLAGLSAGLPKIIGDDLARAEHEAALDSAFCACCAHLPQNDGKGLGYYARLRRRASCQTLADARSFAQGAFATLTQNLEKDREYQGLLLTANSLVPTIGAGAAFLGGAIGLALSSLVGHEALAANLGDLNSSVTLFAAAITMVLGALVAARLQVNQLGPEVLSGETFSQGVKRVVTDLTGAARYLKARVTPGQGLAAIAVHRFLYGLVFISAILMARNVLAGTGLLEIAAGVSTSGGAILGAATAGVGDVGLGQFAVIMGLIGGGGAIAVVLTPLFSRRMGPQRWVAVMYVVAAAAMVLLSTMPMPLVVFAAALILGVGSQGAKIAVDTIVQRDTEDAYRGRAFAFYDVLFNAAFVAAAALAAFIVPDYGWSRPLFWALAALYLLTAAFMYTKAARMPAIVKMQIR